MGAFLLFDDEELHFDAVTTEQAEHTATATEHSVEQGANVSDHVVPGLDRITLEVVVTNTPIKGATYGGTVQGVTLDVFDGRAKATGHADKPKKPLPMMPGAAINALASAASNAIFGTPPSPKASVLKFPSKFDAVRDTLNTLLDWQARAVVGEVITPHRTYSSMIIERVSPSRDATTGTSARITIELREVRIVEVGILTSPIPTEIRGKTKIQKGKQATLPANAAQVAQLKSFWAAGRDRWRAR